jgi:hypothetical protein
MSDAARRLMDGFAADDARRAGEREAAKALRAERASLMTDWDVLGLTDAKLG